MTATEADTIIIDIRGRNGSGKSNLLAHLYKVLATEGFNVVFAEQEIDTPTLFSPERIEKINARMIEHKQGIIIQTTNLNRIA